MYVYIYVYIYIYMYMCVYIYIYIYTQACSSKRTSCEGLASASPGGPRGDAPISLFIIIIILIIITIILILILMIISIIIYMIIIIIRVYIYIHMREIERTIHKYIIVYHSMPYYVYIYIYIYVYIYTYNYLRILYHGIISYHIMSPAGAVRSPRSGSSPPGPGGVASPSAYHYILLHIML